MDVNDVHKDEDAMDIKSVKELIERYFITVPRNGVTYEQRFKEGYKMLCLIAGDFDIVFQTDILSKLQKQTEL